MADKPAGTKRTVDGDGVVRVTEKRSLLVPVLVGGVLAILCAGVFLVRSSGRSAADSAGAPIAPSPPAVHRAPPPEPLSDVPARRRTPPPRAAPASITSPPSAQESVMPSDNAPDEHSGLGLFHPGIKPIKAGIIVPEGFELPPGYVRHYQTTDDGQMLPPILMFHPDHPPLDAQGRPVRVTADRVVPPELAPAGMPIQMLEPPKPSEGGEAGR